MKTQVAFVRWFVLFGCFLPLSSWANYNKFPIETPQVTGTFMEYRPTVTRGENKKVKQHFHGGIDLTPGGSNNIVLPVENGSIKYTISTHTISDSEVDTTYSLWIRHDSGDYVGLGTRYLHVGEYPAGRPNHPDFHDGDTIRDGTKSDTLGTIVTPHDGIGDHLHFEVRARNNLDYMNPLSKLPAITDNSVDYSSAGDWLWTIIDDDDFGNEGRYLDVAATDQFAIARLPSGETFRLLFKGFDRINTSMNRVGFYSIKASFKHTIEEPGGIITEETLSQYTFTADRFPNQLYNSPQYLFNVTTQNDPGDESSVNLDDGYQSTKSQFYYRLFAHDDANNLSISVTDFYDIDLEGYLDGGNYTITNDHFFEVEVADYANNKTTKRLGISTTSIGDFFRCFSCAVWSEPSDLELDKFQRRRLGIFYSPAQPE